MAKYFYRWEGLRFSFYRTPKALYTDPRYRGMDALAKQLYGLFLDRLDLSLKNGWFDEDGRVYIIYTLKEAMDALGCANQKATKLFNELEKYGLIERKHQGLCKPNLIYVLDFLDRSEDGNAVEDFLSTHVRSHENHESGVMDFTCPESWKSQGINTNIINTDKNDTDPILSGWDKDGIEQRQSCEDYFREVLEIDLLRRRYVTERETIDGILDLVTDVCCTKRKMVRIAGDDKPAEAVKSRFMKLNAGHIEYIIHCLSNNSAKVRNIKQYLLAALYNAPSTISPYYQSMVKYDMANGCL